MPTQEEMLQDLKTADAAGDHELANRIATLMGGQPAETPFVKGLSWAANQAKEILPSIGEGALKGIAGIIGLPGTVTNAATDLYTNLVGHPPTDIYGKPITKRIFDTSDVNNAASSAAQAVGLPGEIFHPQTGTGKLASAMTQGGSSMLSANPWAIALGMTSGAAGETADRLLPNSPWTKAAAELTPLIASLPVALKTPQIVKTLAQALLEGAPDLKAAMAGKAAADTSLGMKTLLAHQFPTNSALMGVTKEVAADPMGGAVRRVLNAEDKVMLEKSKIMANSPTPVPITPEAQQVVSNAGTAAAVNNIEPVRAAAAPLFTAAGQDVVNLPNAFNQLRRLAQSNKWAGGPQDIPQMAIDMLKAMRAKQGGQLTADAVADVGNIIKAAGSAEGVIARPYNVTKSEVSKIAQAASPAQKGGDIVFQTGKDWFVNPYKAGPMGESFPDLAPKQLTRPWETMNKVLNDPTTDVDSIKLIAEKLKPTQTINSLGETTNPAFPLMVKQSWTRPELASASPSEFFNTIAGNPTKMGGDVTRAAFKEKVYQSAIANGATVEEATAAAKGADNLATSVQVVSRGHAQMPSGPIMGTPEKAGEQPVSTFARLFNAERLIRFFSAANMMDKAVSRRVMGQISDALTAKDAWPRLAEIAKYDPVENAALVVGHGLASLEIQSQ